MKKYNLFVAMSALLFFVGCTSSQVRGLANGPTIFDSLAPYNYTLEADFTTLFGNVKTGSFGDVVEVSSDEESNVPGKISYLIHGNKVEIPVKVVVRGHGSKGECYFKKLKLKFDKAVVKGTLFEGNKTLNIGTHCNDSMEGAAPSDSEEEIGRLGDQRGPVRESLAYELLRQMGVTGPRTRLVDFTYVATDDQPITRHAFFMEDVDLYAKRNGGERLRDWDKTWKLGSSAPFAKMDPSELAKVFFIEGLLANEDALLQVPAINGPSLKSNFSKPIWNIDIVSDASGRQHPYVFDFDLAISVTGRGLGGTTPTNFKAVTGFENYNEWITFKWLESSRSFFDRKILDATIADLQQRRATLEQTVKSYPVIDDQGRELFQKQLDVFYAILDKYFYMRMTTTLSKAAYLDIQKTKSCRGLKSKVLPLMPGLPVQVIKTSGAMSQVNLLDVRDSLTNPETNLNCAESPLWVETLSLK